MPNYFDGKERASVVPRFMDNSIARLLCSVNGTLESCGFVFVKNITPADIETKLKIRAIDLT